jgi:acetyl-CoA carboxylase biotin carboxylase subunit
MPIRRVFIANRGEIAVRIIRTCRALGIETVLGASVADRDSLPAQLADRVLCIGPARASDSYLKAETVVHAALAVGADALHPGYGFLSERASLARLCEEHGLAFVGPTAAQIEAVGDKLQARALAQQLGIPVVPGGTVGSPEEAQALAQRIGPPLIVKAAGGGGGRGMKRVDRIEELASQVALAAAEAGAAFGDPRVYLERFVVGARHIEVQVLGDGAGRVIHLGERDCSVQRRYQKLLEETPAPALSPRLARDLHAAAVRFAGSLGYRGAGTVEFLVEPGREAFYLLEMNARIQVEHPVTEAVTGIDLVAQQLAIAGGEGLALTQEDVRAQGWALECRVNAEDPARDFQPSPGQVVQALWPQGPGIRVDTHIGSGSRIPPFYDSLMGKIIASGPDRASALARLRAAVAATRITGVTTNLALQAAVLAAPEIEAGGVDTGFLPRLLARQGIQGGTAGG